MEEVPLAVKWPSWWLNICWRSRPWEYCLHVLWLQIPEAKGGWTPSVCGSNGQRKAGKAFEVLRYLLNPPLGWKRELVTHPSPKGQNWLQVSLAWEWHSPSFQRLGANHNSGLAFYAWKIYSMIKIKMRIRLSHVETNSVKLELRSVIRKLPASES